jgi:hypothetical protein
MIQLKRLRTKTTFPQNIAFALETKFKTNLKIVPRMQIFNFRKTIKIVALKIKIKIMRSKLMSKEQRRRHLNEKNTSD